MNANLSQIVSQITGILNQIISVAVVLLIFGAVIQIYGIRIPQLPAIDVTKLAWLTGAIWLARGGRIS